MYKIRLLSHPSVSLPSILNDFSSPIEFADIPGKIHLTSTWKIGEACLQDVALQSGWESFLLAVPFVGMVIVGVFRLDQIATRPRREGGVRHRLQGNDELGSALMSDPDGRPWDDAQPRQYRTE